MKEDASTAIGNLSVVARSTVQSALQQLLARGSRDGKEQAELWAWPCAALSTTQGF